MSEVVIKILQGIVVAQTVLGWLSI